MDLGRKSNTYKPAAPVAWSAQSTPMGRRHGGGAEDRKTSQAQLGGFTYLQGLAQHHIMLYP